MTQVVFPGRDQATRIAVVTDSVSYDRLIRPAAVYLIMQRKPMCEVEVSMASPWRAAGR